MSKYSDFAMSDTGFLKQACSTAHDYLYNAIKDIDQQFGEGYAEQHPELVAAYMHVAAMDFNNAMNIKYFSKKVDGVL